MPMRPNIKPPGHGLMIGSLACGIIGLILSLVFAWFLGIPAAIVGLILGIISKKKLSEVGAPSGMATAGIICSAIGIIIGIITAVACISCLAYDWDYYFGLYGL